MATCCIDRAWALRAVVLPSVARSLTCTAGPASCSSELNPINRAYKQSHRFTTALCLAALPQLTNNERRVWRGRGVKMGGKTKAKWYAVHRGRTPGVYRTWAEAEPLVKGFAGARYKGFATESEARAFVAAAPSLTSVAAHNATARMATGGAASTFTPTAAASGSGSTAFELCAL